MEMGQVPNPPCSVRLCGEGKKEGRMIGGEGREEQGKGEREGGTKGGRGKGRGGRREGREGGRNGERRQGGRKEGTEGGEPHKHDTGKDPQCRVRAKSITRKRQGRCTFVEQKVLLHQRRDRLHQADSIPLPEDNSRLAFHPHTCVQPGSHFSVHRAERPPRQQYMFGYLRIMAKTTCDGFCWLPQYRNSVFPDLGTVRQRGKRALRDVENTKGKKAGVAAPRNAWDLNPCAQVRRPYAYPSAYD